MSCREKRQYVNGLLWQPTRTPTALIQDAVHLQECSVDPPGVNDHCWFLVVLWERDAGEEIR